MIDDPDNDSYSDSDDKEPNDTNFAGVMKRVRFDDDDNIVEVTNDEDAIKTVEHVKRKCTKRDKFKAESRRIFQHVAGNPLCETIACAVSANSVKNIPTNLRDVMLAKGMLAPSKHEI